MTHGKKNSVIASIAAIALMAISTSGWAEYTQKQNKVDDKDSDRLSQPRDSSDQKNDYQGRRKSSSDHHHDTSTDNRSGTNPNVPSGSDKKSGY